MYKWEATLNKEQNNNTMQWAHTKNAFNLEKCSELSGALCAFSSILMNFNQTPLS